MAGRFGKFPNFDRIELDVSLGVEGESAVIFFIFQPLEAIERRAQAKVTFYVQPLGAIARRMQAKVLFCFSTTWSHKARDTGKSD